MLSTVARCASPDPPAQDPADRGDDQQRAAPECRPARRVMNSVIDHSSEARRARALARNSSLLFIGGLPAAPGRTRRGSASAPEGLRLSAGCDSGFRDRPGSARHRAASCERWYRPLLNGPTSPFVPRVPSGNTISESRSPIRVRHPLDRCRAARRCHPRRHAPARSARRGRPAWRDSGGWGCVPIVAPATGRTRGRIAAGSADQMTMKSRWLE